MEFTDCPVNEMLDNVIRLAMYQSEFKAISVTKDLAAGLSVARVNKSQLEQVFLNILTNAAQAMPKGGQLKIATRFSDNGKIEVIFADTGEGMTPEQTHRVFEPFYTTKIKGAGLGLSVSYNIVRLHGGDIRVASEGPGKGATFTVVLPYRAGGNVERNREEEGEDPGRR
jgi:signal transduction histidine kinase